MANQLAALLVGSGALSAASLERARQHQLAHGGAFDTALLELDLLTPKELPAWLARASGLPPAPDGAILPEPSARQLVPARVAERYRIAPFRVAEGELHALACLPVDLGELEELGFMLSVRVVPYVAPEWRVREVRALLRGEPLPDRFAALVEHARAAALPTAPARSWPGLGGSVEGSGPAYGGGPDDEVDDALTFTIDPEEGAPVAVRRSRQVGPGGVHARTPAAPSMASATGKAPVAGWSGAAMPEPDPAPAGGTGPRRRSAFEVEEPLAAALAAAGEAAEPGAVLDLGPALEIEPPEPGPGGPVGQPSEVPTPAWTRAEASAVLSAARNRDEVVEVALRFARGTFPAVALFAVGHGRVSGQDARGWEGARERARGLRVSADVVTLLRTALETRAPCLGPPAREPGNAAFFDALGRPWPSTALVFPVAVSGRTVALLYGDVGASGVAEGAPAEVVSLWGEVGGAFERILRETKRLRAAGPPLPAPRPAPTDAWEVHAGPAQPPPGVGPLWEVQEPARDERAAAPPGKEQEAAERWSSH